MQQLDPFLFTRIYCFYLQCAFLLVFEILTCTSKKRTQECSTISPRITTNLSFMVFKLMISCCLSVVGSNAFFERCFDRMTTCIETIDNVGSFSYETLKDGQKTETKAFCR